MAVNTSNAPCWAWPSPIRPRVWASGRGRDGRGSAAQPAGVMEEDEPARRLAAEGGHAFVSASLRPYLIAAISDRDEQARGRPTLVVVGDDRTAREVAGDLKSWLARGGSATTPREAWPMSPISRLRRTSSGCGSPLLTRCSSPIREAHPLRSSPSSSVRRRRALGEGARPVAEATVVRAAGWGAARPRRVRRGARGGGLRAGRPGRGAGPVRDARRAARRVPGDGGPGPCGSTCSTSRSNRCAGSPPFTQRSLGDAQEVEIAPRAELRGRAPGAGRDRGCDGGLRGDAEPGERPDIAELLPVERFGALLDLLDERTRVAGRPPRRKSRGAEGSLG